ncbi:hypothetical protein IRJ41_010252 [Triplophysa rosa]|uniref:Uncharacterized protein n=1 Tax=Triplophysa rosa TaxID=992332 RepID=A0A9W7TME7_TRIRA|nr:hypothetical protein IRJ41_010252 [Triplophysa rosa]
MTVLRERDTSTIFQRRFALFFNRKRTKAHTDEDGKRGKEEPKDHTFRSAQCKAKNIIGVESCDVIS